MIRAMLEEGRWFCSFKSCPKEVSHSSEEINAWHMFVAVGTEASQT